MPDFNELRQSIQNARKERREIDLALFRARERAKRLQEERKRLLRYIDPENDDHRAELQRLERRQKQAERVAGKLQEELAGIYDRQTGQLEGFAPFADPRENLGRLDDRHPFLLFPLRLETRFKEFETNEGTRHQLWVRIFPDDAVIDTFEETLSEVEVDNARAYYINLWKAGGVEAQERGAWRSLVGSHGSGRAWYILQHYAPVNTDDRPAKENSGDLILVIASETEIPAAERPAIDAYWTAYWRADADLADQQAAYDDLVAALGETRAAEVVDTLRPSGLAYRPPASVSREEVNVQVAYLQFPERETVETKQQSWSRAPKVEIMPDRFILLAFQDGEQVLERIGNPVPSPLTVGPDPLAGEAEQMKIVDGDLQVNEELQWMTDFDEAIRVGMGFKIDLSPLQARTGFDRLFVIGLRMSADEAEAKKELEELFKHHQFSKKGFGLLPQGTPTNNTEKMPSGLSRLDDPDVSFDNFFLKEDLFTETADPFLKADGQWLAESLGVDPAVFKKAYHADGRDQCEARAMNTALWPATIGYFMESMMQPVFEETVIDQTRAFFRQFVSGRGAVPAIRIGKQPYGILPTAAFSRLEWMQGRIAPPTHAGSPFGLGGGFIRGLYDLLEKVSADWSKFREEVSYVGKSGDPHQILLDVVGLHATSVEFYQRYAESFQQLHNRLNMEGLGGAFLAMLIAAGYVQSGRELLGRLGYQGSGEKADVPEILEKFFLAKANLLKKERIDDRPLSEINPIRTYTAGGKNYIGWLIEAASASHDALRKQEKFLDDQPPSALLYLMLRYALDQGYYDTSLKLHRRAELLSGTEARRLRKDPNFLYVDQESPVSGESKWAYLYKQDDRITGNPEMLIGDYIPTILAEAPEARQFREQIEALQHLENSPTARLERAFAEHIDCCTYRLDAWKQGILQYQLSAMRGTGETASQRQGTYLGAYGWLEEVRPEHKKLSPVDDLPEDLQENFQRKGEPPLMRDSTNAGYIHAPSLNHAVTAAILRNGYLSNATPSNPETMAVNLSSERVRLALSFIEGIRNGQKLGALLGYQLERGLHDRYELQLDQFIYELRKAFPLVADRVSTTRTEREVPIRQIEARNVVDGLALINHIKESGQGNYPYGKDLPEDTITQAQRDAIDAEVNKLQNIHDAIADLALAESVHQVVQNNYDRAGATLDAYAKGDYPPLPDVVRTPRSGLTVTYRVGIHLEPGLSPDTFPDTAPRAKAEPAVNKWLSDLLPPAADVVCSVRFFDHLTESELTEIITQADLQLQPLDLLFLLQTGDEQAMTILDDIILHHVHTTFSPRPDVGIFIEYATPVEDKVTFFELAPMIRSLRSLVLESRPLAPGDVRMPDEASKAENQQATLDKNRIEKVRTLLQDFLDNRVSPLVDTLKVLVDVEDIGANQEPVINALDAWIAEVALVARRAGRFGLMQSNIGFIYERRRGLYEAMLSKVTEIVRRWEDKLSQYDMLITDYQSLPAAASDVEKFEILRRAENVISTEATIPDPGTTAESFKTGVLDGKRSAFVSKKNSIEALLSTHAPGLKALRDLILAEKPVTAFDLLEIDLSEQDRQMLVFAEDLYEQLKNLQGEAESRLAATQPQLDAHDTAAAADKRVKALQEAGKALLGDDFLMVPEFELAPEAAGEWEKAWNQSDGLLDFQRTQLGNRFPVDDWMYGVARVREKMHHWENLTFLAEGFDAAGTKEVELTPLQFPQEENDRWLALQFKTPEEEFHPDKHKLLYTAHFSTPFDQSSAQCGLLVDEWTEVIPTKEETTGLTFHYDRPNSEPPQTMLLVLPTDFREGWQWRDIVDALHETLDAAKARAIEPGQIDREAYARFLPATISAVTVYPITIALNYAFNNEVYKALNIDTNE